MRLVIWYEYPNVFSWFRAASRHVQCSFTYVKVNSSTGILHRPQVSCVDRLGPPPSNRAEATAISSWILQQYLVIRRIFKRSCDTTVRTRHWRFCKLQRIPNNSRISTWHDFYPQCKLRCQNIFPDSGFACRGNDNAQNRERDSHLEISRVVTQCCQFYLPYGPGSSNEPPLISIGPHSRCCSTCMRIPCPNTT